MQIFDEVVRRQIVQEDKIRHADLRLRRHFAPDTLSTSTKYIINVHQNINLLARFIYLSTNR